MSFLDTFIEKSCSAHGIEVDMGHQIPVGDYDDVLGEVSQFQKKSDTWPLIYNMIGSLGVAPQQGDYQSFAQVYATVVWVYVAGWLISSSIGSVPIVVCEGTEKNPQEIDKPENEVVKLLAEPNEFESGSEMIEETSLNMELMGDAYIKKMGIVSGLASKLYNLEPYYMNIIPDPMTKVKAYEYKVGGQSMTIPPEEIAHFKYVNPNSAYHGQGTVMALQASLITELYREAYNKTYFENEARPDVILTQNPDITKGIPPMTPEMKRQAAVKWMRGFGGARRQRLPVLLESGMDIKILSEAMRDMDFREMEKSLRERIFGAFGVPPAMAGIYEYANYANAKEQIRIFWKVTLPPKCNRIARTLTRNIIRPYDSKLWCKFDLSDITALEETVKEREERLSRMLERGGLTLGEYRQGMGMPVTNDDPWKDKKVMSTNLIPLDDFFAPPPEEGTGEEPSIPGQEEKPDTGMVPNGGAGTFEAGKYDIGIVKHQQEVEKNNLRERVIEEVKEFIERREVPEINITVPQQPTPNFETNIVLPKEVSIPAPVVNVEAPIVKVEAPIVNVEAPIVNIPQQSAPIVNIEAPIVKVDIPKQKSKKRIPIRDKDGFITEVREVDEE